MARHQLSLEVPTTMNVCRFLVSDSSAYSDNVAITCPILAITLPGFNYSVEFGEDDLGALPFSLNLTACDLEIQTQDCETTYNGLPDGIWVLRYSLSPNDLVYVEYNHLRITKALIKYNEILCDLDVAACEPDSETEDKLMQLHKIRMYLDAAKAMVEICHNPKRGMELYSYANKLLDKFSCRSCQS